MDVRDGSGVMSVTDTITVDVGRPAGDVARAGLAVLCEVVVVDEAVEIIGDERVIIGGGREVIIGGRREVIMGGKVIMGVSDDTGGITGGSPSVVVKIGGPVTTGVADGRIVGGVVGGGMSDDAGGVTGKGPPGIDKDEGQSLTAVVIDGRTPGAKDRLVTENVSCDAGRVDGDDPASTGEDREYPVSAVVTDSRTVGGKDGAVTDDAEGITGDVHAGIGNDVGPSVPPTKDPPISSQDKLEDTTGVHDEVVLELESNGLDGIAVAPVLVNGIADVASEAETILSPSPESLAT